MGEPCVFCDIARGLECASLVHEDELTLAFLDRRQFHPGHTLVIPRRHVADVRALDARLGAALMMTISRITRAVGTLFPNTPAAHTTICSGCTLDGLRS